MLDATRQSNKSQKTVVTIKKVKRAENNDDDDSVTDNENNHDKDQMAIRTHDELLGANQNIMINMKYNSARNANNLLFQKGGGNLRKQQSENAEDPHLLKVINGGASNKDSQTVSLTQQIFVNDTKQQSVLPVETVDKINKQATNTVAKEILEQLKSLQNEEQLRPGFDGYEEQEQLDRASVNDFIQTSQKVGRPIGKTDQNKALQDLMNRHRPFQFTGNQTNMKQLTGIGDISNLDSAVKEDSFYIDGLANQQQFQSSIEIKSPLGCRKGSIQQAEPVLASAHVADRRLLSKMGSKDNAVKRKITEKTSLDENFIEKQQSYLSGEASVAQGGQPPKELHNENQVDQKSSKTQRKSYLETRKDPSLSLNEQKTHILRENDEEQQSPSVEEETETKGGTSFPLSRMTTVVPKNLLSIDQKDRPQTKSSMGRFVGDILRQKYMNEEIKTKTNVKDMNRLRNNVAAISKSLDVPILQRKKVEISKVINQDSILIKHEFDAGKSKLLETHDMTQKARIRMQKLIAMLRNKQDNQLPISDDDFNSLCEDTSCPEFTVEDIEKKSQLTNNENTQKQVLAGFKPDAEERQRNNQNLKSTRKDGELDRIESQIRANINKFKSVRNVLARATRESQAEMKASAQIATRGTKDSDGAGSKITEERGSDYGSLVQGGQASHNGDFHNQRYKNEKDDFERDSETFGSIKDSHLIGVVDSLNPSFLDKIDNDRDIGYQNLTQSLNLNDKWNQLKVGGYNLAGHHAHQWKPNVGGQPSRKIINTQFLTSVPRRGRMVNTKAYIRKNLQAYADNKYFAFTKLQKDQLKPVQTDSPARERRRNHIIGQPMRTLETRHFLSSSVPQGPLASLSVPNSTTNAELKPKGKKGRGTTLDYVPIIVPNKKRASKNFRISKHRNRGSLEVDKPQTPLDNVRIPTTMEEDAENDTSQAVSQAACLSDREQNENYETLYEENEDLRKQLGDMVQVFEQYLKVATLKEAADRLKKQKKKPQDSVMLNDSVGGDVPNIGGEDEPDEEIKEVTQNINNTEKRNSQDDFRQTGQPMVPSDSKLEVYKDDINERQTLVYTPKNAKRCTEMKNLNTEKKSKELKAFAEVFANSRRSSAATRKRVVKYVRVDSSEVSGQIFMSNAMLQKEGLFMNHHMPFIRQPTEGSAFNGHRPSTSKSKKIVPAATRQVSLGKIVVPELQPDKSITHPIGILQANEHKTHNHWIKKIQDLWDRMTAIPAFQESDRIEQQIKENEKRIRVLKIENMKENARVISLQTDLIKKGKGKAKSAANVAAGKLLKKFAKVQKRVKVQMEIGASFDCWGFQNYIISHIIKCRLLEDVIDCAQRCLLRPDQKVERELALMKMLQQQTWEDLHQFVGERDLLPWRTWDNPAHPRFRRAAGITLVREPGVSLDDMQNYYARESQALHLWIDRLARLDREQATHILICREMAQFVNYQVGSTAWLTISRLKALGELNAERAEGIEAEAEKRREAPPKAHVTHLNWLQLTPGNKDLTVVGPIPLWMKYLKKHEVTREDVDKDEAEGASLKSPPQQHIQPPAIHSDHTDMQGSSDQAEQARKQDKDQVQDQEQTQAAQKQLTAALLEKQKEQKAEPEVEIEAMDEGVEKAIKDNAVQKELDLDGEVQEIRSKWQEVLAKEKQKVEQRRKEQEEARAKRLARLFGNESSDDEEVLHQNLDRNAAGTDIGGLMDKVDVHLKVEMNLLMAFQDKDGTKNRYMLADAINTDNEQKQSAKGHFRKDQDENSSDNNLSQPELKRQNSSVERFNGKVMSIIENQRPNSGRSPHSSSSREQSPQMLSRSITESLKGIKRQSSDLYLNKKKQKGSMPATEGQTPRAPVTDHVFVNEQGGIDESDKRDVLKRLSKVRKDKDQSRLKITGNHQIFIK